MDNRIHWLDSARAIAIMLVVFTHAHERAGDIPYYITSIFYSIDRIGVPIFFMISGGLLIPKLSNVDIVEFYKKKIPKFIFLLIFYTILTNMVYFMTMGEGFLDSLSKSIINYNGILNTSEKYGEYGYARQMWFMYSIIGIYLIAPFLSKILTNSKTKDIMLFLLVCILLNQLRLTLKYYFGAISSFDRVGVEMTGSYLSYFIIGYLIINRMENVKIGYIKLIAISIIPPLLLLLLELKKGDINWTMHWYSGSLYILISSVSVFMMIKKYFINKEIKPFSILSKYSFGIYLIHYAIIFIVLFFIRPLNLNVYLSMLIIFSTTIFVSIAYCKIISMNDYLKRAMI